VTSLLGVLLVLAATASPLLQAGTTWTEASIGVCAGALLLLAPDTLVSKVKSLIK
jgi:hypothetical protein